MNRVWKGQEPADCTGLTYGLPGTFYLTWFTFLNKIVPFPRPLLQLFGKLLLDVCSLLDECYEVLAESLSIIDPSEK